MMWGEFEKTPGGRILDKTADTRYWINNKSILDTGLNKK
jgi:hypothetical protein